MLHNHKEGLSGEVTSELALNISWPDVTSALRECHPWLLLFSLGAPVC